MQGEDDLGKWREHCTKGRVENRGISHSVNSRNSPENGRTIPYRLYNTCGAGHGSWPHIHSLGGLKGNNRWQHRAPVRLFTAADLYSSAYSGLSIVAVRTKERRGREPYREVGGEERRRRAQTGPVKGSATRRSCRRILSPRACSGIRALVAIGASGLALKEWSTKRSDQGLDKPLSCISFGRWACLRTVTIWVFYYDRAPTLSCTAPFNVQSTRTLSLPYDDGMASPYLPCHILQRTFCHCDPDGHNAVVKANVSDVV